MKVAMVTGAGSGIGKAVAQAFAREGYHVVLAGRRADLLAEVARQIGPNALAVPTDVADPHSVKALFAACVNLSGVFYCMQEAFRMMKEQEPRGGRIINNGSISAHAPRPNSAPYTSTKHAVTGLTKSGSLDGRKYDIAVCQIDIGNAGTEMTEKMKTGMPQANGTTAPEPTMDVENVARTVIYMASLPLEANAQFVTVMATKMPYIGRG